MRDFIKEGKVRLITSAKYISYMCLVQNKKIIKNIPVIIKQFKDIINTNNSFLRAKTDYVKETYLQNQKVRSHSHIATTTKQKLYGMNLVATEHKLKFL